MNHSQCGFWKHRRADQGLEFDIDRVMGYGNINSVLGMGVGLDVGAESSTTHMVPKTTACCTCNLGP